MCPTPAVVSPLQEERPPLSFSTEVRAQQKLPLLPTTSPLTDVLSAQKLRSSKAIIDETMLPEALKTVASSMWKDTSLLNKKIKEILTHGKKKSCMSRNVPQCLLQDAENLEQKLIVINYLLSISDKAADFQRLQKIYKAPSANNERMLSQCDMVITLAADSQEFLIENAIKSASGRRVLDSIRRNTIPHHRHGMSKKNS